MNRCVLLSAAGLACSLGVGVNAVHGQAIPRAIYTTLAGSPTSDIPGDPMMRKFTNLRRPHGSPNGMHWLLNAGQGGSGTVNMTMKGSGLTGAPVLLPGALLPWGASLDTLAKNAGINDAGHWVVAGTDDTPDATDAFIAVDIGAGLTAVAREGGLAFPAAGGVNWGATLDSASIDNNSAVSFYSTLSGDALMDNALWHGMSLVLREGVTIPGNQPVGIMDTIAGSTAIRNSRYYRSANGLTWIMSGSVGTTASRNEVTIVNGDIAGQEGTTVFPPYTDAVSNNGSGLGETQMGPDGNWFWRGANVGGSASWVMRTGEFIARETETVTPCSTETWTRRGGPAGAAFFTSIGNGVGDYILGGVTDIENVAHSGVLVLNGRKIVLRSEDPIDLDGDGETDDDGVYIRQFIFDEAFLTPDLKLYIVTDIKTATGVQDSAGRAFFVKQLTAPCVADFNCSESVEPADIFFFLDAWFSESATPGGGELRTDYDGSGAVEPADIFFFLNAWFSELGSPC